MEQGLRVSVSVVPVVQVVFRPEQEGRSRIAPPEPVGADVVKRYRHDHPDENNRDEQANALALD